MVTPLIDGMNLVAKEYIACQREHDGVLDPERVRRRGRGAVQRGARESVRRARRRRESWPQALGHADDEKSACAISRCATRVMKFDAQHWARTFIQQLATTESSLAAAFGRHQHRGRAAPAGAGDRRARSRSFSITTARCARSSANRAPRRRRRRFASLLERLRASDERRRLYRQRPQPSGSGAVFSGSAHLVRIRARRGHSSRRQSELGALGPRHQLRVEGRNSRAAPALRAIDARQLRSRKSARHSSGITARPTRSSARGRRTSSPTSSAR